MIPTIPTSENNNPYEEILKKKLQQQQQLQSIIPQPVKGPEDISLDQSRSSYLQALQQPAPVQGDFKPSIGRRILAGFAGAMAGMHDPRSGVEVGTQVSQAPYNQALGKYQQELERKRNLFETQEGLRMQKLKEQDVEAGIGEKKARTGLTETETRSKEQEMMPEWQQFLHNLSKPEQSKEHKRYVLETPNGKVFGVVEREEGGYYDPATQIYFGPKSYTNAYPMEQSRPSDKPPAKLDDYTADLEAHMKAKGMKLSDATEQDRIAVHQKIAESRARGTAAAEAPYREKAEANKDTREDRRLLATAKNQFNRSIESRVKPLRERATQINEAYSLVKAADQGGKVNTEAQVALVPRFLTLMAGGQGSGLRMNEAELNRIFKGRTSIEALQSWVSSFGKSGTFKPLSKEQISAMKDAIEGYDKIIHKNIDNVQKYRKIANDASAEHELTGALIDLDNELTKSDTGELDKFGSPKLVNPFGRK